jgi:uncharacterized protein
MVEATIADLFFVGTTVSDQFGGTSEARAARLRARPRLSGVDAARGLALAGMFLAHYVRSRDTGDAGWLQAIDNAADGRAAPLFCVLLGVGAGILAERRGPASVARRGGALLALGVAIWPLVDHVLLILPHYGLLLVLAAVAVRLPRGWMLPLAVGAWLIPTVVVAFVDDHGLRRAGQPETYADLGDVREVGWELLWSGAYPIVGWAGFALVGLWLSRRALDRPRTQVRLLAVSAAVAAAQPVFAALFAAVDGAAAGRDARGLATVLDTSAHSNQLGWYLVASATATAAIAACLLVARRIRLGPLALVGRYALSAYLLHLVFGALWVWPWRERVKPSLALQMAVALVVLTAISAVAWAWSTRFTRGPAEALVRAVSR